MRQRDHLPPLHASFDPGWHSPPTFGECAAYDRGIAAGIGVLLGFMALREACEHRRGEEVTRKRIASASDRRRSVSCPTCRARVGDPCHVDGIAMVQSVVHADRALAASRWPL